nr:YIP1 family protein [Ardenticatena sp.]
MRATDVLPTLLGLVDRPLETFHRIAAHAQRAWIVPLMLMLLMTGVHAVATREARGELEAQILEYTLTHSRFVNQLSPAERERLLAQQRQRAGMFDISTPLGLAITLLLSALAVLVGWLIWGGVLYGVALLLGGEDLTFAPFFNVAAWSWLPIGIGLLVQAAYVIWSGHMPFYEGLSFLVASGNPIRDQFTPLHTFLSKLTVWQIWAWWLLINGTAAVSGFSRRKAAGMVLTVWLVFAGLQIVPVVISSRLQGF